MPKSYRFVERVLLWAILLSLSAEISSASYYAPQSRAGNELSQVIGAAKSSACSAVYPELYNVSEGDDSRFIVVVASLYYPGPVGGIEQWFYVNGENEPPSLLASDDYISERYRCVNFAQILSFLSKLDHLNVTVDHNGNVQHLFDANTKEIIASYEYSPFGVPIKETGDVELCKFRTQTKYYDVESGLLYYGMRYYDPRSGKWLSRDPLGEAGGLNMFAWCRNDGVNKYDYLGMDWQPLDMMEKFIEMYGDDGLALLQLAQSGSNPMALYQRDNAFWSNRGWNGSALSIDRGLSNNKAAQQLYRGLKDKYGKVAGRAAEAGIRIVGANFINAEEQGLLPYPDGYAADMIKGAREAGSTAQRMFENEVKYSIATAVGLRAGGEALKMFRFKRARYLAKHNDELRMVNTGGLRNDIPLTSDQMEEVLQIAEELGLPRSKVRFTAGETGYLEAWDVLFVGTDVLPGTSSARANSRVSMRGALGHEIVGHRMAGRAGASFPARSLLDEVQASVRAARHTPGLTSTERITLLRDAAERLRAKGFRWRDVRDKLYLD